MKCTCQVVCEKRKGPGKVWSKKKTKKQDFFNMFELINNNSTTPLTWKSLHFSAGSLRMYIEFLIIIIIIIKGQGFKPHQW